MLRRFVRVSLAFVALILAGAVLAAEGRTPVFASGTFLGVDGRYVVTRNIAGGAGSVISVAPGADHVTIRNGVLVGGTIGIDAPGFVRKVDIEDVKIRDAAAQGIHLGSVEGAARDAAGRHAVSAVIAH